MNKIIRGNCLIADFLDLKYKNTDKYYIENHEYLIDSFFENDTDCIYSKENLLYHSHWDWLEDAILKIEPNITIDRTNIKTAWNQVIDYISKPKVCSICYQKDVNLITNIVKNIETNAWFCLKCGGLIKWK